MTWWTRILCKCNKHVKLKLLAANLTRKVAQEWTTYFSVFLGFTIIWTKVCRSFVPQTCAVVAPSEVVQIENPCTCAALALEFGASLQSRKEWHTFYLPSHAEAFNVCRLGWTWILSHVKQVSKHQENLPLKWPDALSTFVELHQVTPGFTAKCFLRT